MDYTPVNINGETYNFPNVPTTPVERNVTSNKKIAELKQKQANINAISRQLQSELVSNKRLDKELQVVRRQEEERQRAAKLQEAKEEAELFAELERLEKEDCKKNGKCTIMGGKYKTRKNKKRKGKGKKYGKSIKKSIRRNVRKSKIRRH